MNFRRRQVDWHEVALDLAMDLREIERKMQKTQPWSYESLSRFEAAWTMENRII